MKVVDMHCDTISALYNAMRKDKEGNVSPSDFGLKKNHLHIDLEKMEKGDYLLQNFGLFVNLKGEEDPLELCLKLMDLFYKEIGKNKEKINIALKYEDIIHNKNKGKISALLTIEEGGVTKGSLSHLRNYYRLGVRMLTLTWNHENEIGYPSIVRKEAEKRQRHNRGLKEFGIMFIEEMEELGMIIDVSHLSDEGVEDVLKYTRKPFVASHSNARQVCNHVRNLKDNFIKKMASRGCVIGINLYPPFLKEEIDGRIEKGNIGSIIHHIKHIISVGGTQCIGLGSDFDGIPGHQEIKDASYMPKLAQRLEDAGISYNVIEKIFYKNVLNLYKEVL